ncbi:MAG: UvrD-helicase domain-containing protein [Kiritimatiellales bacterium]|nr:UvrD-helicase domain-containing protein [Kiritimatiellales bacterium]
MNLIFNASAGTGKTWQVTEIYTALVLGREHEHLPPNRQPVPPEKILLMTFTDNAAAELRQRVSEKMLAAEKTETDEQADRARRVLRSLPAAHISTIHAFCAGLLREYALELGLSPNFQTLENEARDALLDEVLKAEIFQCLENGADFREFCAGISVLGDHEYSLISTIRSLLEKAASRGLDLSRAEAMLPPPDRTVGEKEFCKIYEQLRSIEADRGLPAKAAGVFQTLEKILQNFPDIGNFDGLTRFTGKEMKEISDALAALKERFLTETFYAQNIDKFQAFARCLSGCARGFTEAKRARDGVDFGDQLLLARDVLKNKFFDEPLFNWMIVDEVQDTSRVQCEVIEALWTRNVNLVICGDKKQSIYAWRSADPNVMPDLESAMEQRGGQKRVDLKKSYRSNGRVIEAVNALFGGVYNSYDALEPQDSPSGEKPCVEWMDSEESSTEEEMAAVARRIRLLVDGGEEWRPGFGHNGKTFVENEPFNFGDILILLKRSTHQDALEKALRDAGIPYTSGGKGKALFEQQEVRDLLLFLQVLCEPSNDLALVGFLRSPFASLTDDEIVRLGWDGETFDHEILRKQFFNLGPGVSLGVSLGVSPLILVDSKNTNIKGLTPRLTPKLAAERLLRYRAMIGEKPASQLIREMVRETAFDAHLAGLPGGEQKLANFKKALDWIRAAERGGQVLLPDVVRLFEKYIQTPPRSGAAEALLPDPAQNAVTIMTVHAAKGLTKRVCFVPDISFGDLTEPGFAMFSPKGTLEMNISGLSGDKVKSPGWDAAREADKGVRDLESTNVFYVAMTRARDLVVLSGAGTKDSKGWKKLAAGFLASASPDILRTLSFAEIPEREGFKPEALGFRQEVNFQPLEIQKGLERKPVTSLVEKRSEFSVRSSEAGNSTLYGTAGHVALEELAKNGWSGDIPELVRLFGGGDELLIKQLEAAREVLRAETAGAVSLFAEHPFVLKRGDLILDGTIDLLAEFSNGWKIFDYKFTNESLDTALETYSPQLSAYKEAIEKLNPDSEVSARLILIGETVKVISLRG